MFKSVFTFFLILTTTLHGQHTIVKGRVSDLITGEPITGVNISLLHTTEGTTTNFEGNYVFKTEANADTLVFTYVGYATKTIIIKKGITQVFNIKMSQEGNEMKPVVVSNKTNRAIRIIERAQDAKSKYNVGNVNAYESENFTKIQIAINNVSKSNYNKKLIESVEGIFDTFNSLSDVKGKEVLPIFLSENLSHYYFNKNPQKTKEVIIASRVKGVGVEDGTFLSQLLGSTFQQYNFNNNLLNILEKDFISPISKSSFLYYNYKMRGSSYPYGSTRKIYQIEVTPKNPLDLCFTGYIWIEDSSFALTGVSLSITNKANLNFVEKLKITQECELTESGVYFPIKNRVLIDVAEISKVSAGMVAVFTSSSENIITNKPREMKFFDYPISVEDNAQNKSDEYWDSARHEDLTDDEKRALAKIDTVANLKIIKNRVEMVDIAVTGYKTFGKVDYGPYVLLYGANALEGHKIRVGAKTNISFSRKMILSGYVAYGINDHPGQQWKYNAQYEYILSRKHWSVAGCSYRKDVEQIGITDDNYGTSNLFNTIAIFGASQLNRAKESKIWLNSEFKSGWNGRIAFSNKEYQFERINDFNFAYYDTPNDTVSKSSNFTNSTITLGLRWAPKEYYLQNDNERIRQSKPGSLALSVNYTKGLKGGLGSRFDYNRITASVEKGLSFGYWGRTKFTLTGTRVFEILPYPILEVHRGNESFIYSSSAWNLMNFFEFVTDQSAFIKAEHHFNGALLNRIPLMKKLKWREFVEGRAMMGRLSQGNIDLIPDYDDEGYAVSKVNGSINTVPYIEIAYGFENIFKVLQIVATHRLTHLDAPNVRKFGLKMNLSVSF